MDDTDLQRRLQEATKTKALDLSSLRLTYSLPPAISQLKYLRSITLYKNLLETIPSELFRFVLLEELNLFRNKLATIPTNLSTLAHLKILNLGSNQLEILPPQLFKLSQLEELDLSNNGISVLPAEIKHLTRLRDLGLFRNKFKALPGEIAQLRQLKKLDVSQNQIVNMPSRLGELKLQTLNVAENPLRFPPIDVVRRGRQAILDFLQQELTEPVKCVAEGPGIQAGLVGLPASFTIIAHTAAGIKRTAGGDNFIVRLVPISVIDGDAEADGAAPVAKSDITPHANGTASATANGSSAPVPEKPSSAGDASQDKSTAATAAKDSKKKKNRRRHDSDDSASFTDDESGEDTEDSEETEESATESSEEALQTPVEVSPPEPVDTALYGIVVDNYDGTYSVQYTLESAAEYNIEVTLYGEHIENSPFYLKVEPDLRHEYRQMEKKLEEERLRREAAETQVATLQREKADLEAQIRSLQAEVSSFTSERTQFADTIHQLKIQPGGSGLSLATSSPNRLSSRDLSRPVDDSGAPITPRNDESPRGNKSERRKSGRSKHRNDSSIPRNTSTSSAADTREANDDSATAQSAPVEVESAMDPKELRRERRKSRAVEVAPAVDSNNNSGNVTRESSLKESSKGEPKTPKSNKHGASGNGEATAVQSPGGPNYKRTNSTPNNAGRNLRTSTPPADLSRSNSDYPLEPTTPTSAPDSEAIETKVPSFKDRFMFWLTRSKSSGSSETTVKKSKKDDKKEEKKEKKEEKEEKKEEKKEAKKARHTSINMSASPSGGLSSSSTNASATAPTAETGEPKDKKKKKNKEKDGDSPDTPLSNSTSTGNQQEPAHPEEDLPTLATTHQPEDPETASPSDEHQIKSSKKKSKKPHLDISGALSAGDDSGATPRGQTPRHGTSEDGTEEPDSARKKKTKKKAKKPKKEEEPADDEEVSTAPKVVLSNEYPSEDEE